MQFFFFLCALIFVSGNALFAKPLQINVHAKSAILMNADTGTILYEKGAHTKRVPASITKVATAACALRSVGNMNVKIKADPDAISSLTEEQLKRSNYKVPYRLIPGGTHMGIKKGEVLSLRDLFFG